MSMGFFALRNTYGIKFEVWGLKKVLEAEDLMGFAGINEGRKDDGFDEEHDGLWKGRIQPGYQYLYC